MHSIHFADGRDQLRSYDHGIHRLWVPQPAREFALHILWRRHADDCSSFSVTQNCNVCGTCQSRSTTDCKNTIQWICQNCSCGMTPVEKFTPYRTKIRLPQDRFLEVLVYNQLETWHFQRKAHLFPQDFPLHPLKVHLRSAPWFDHWHFAPLNDDTYLED